MFFITSTHASGPSSNRLLNYQLRLSDTSGIPVADGTKNIKISFYAASTGGTPLATDCGTTGTPIGRKVVFTNGVGSVLIGETTADSSHNCTDSSAPNAISATLFDNTSLFIGISVEADAEMTPRKRIVATGYSLNADKLDDLDSSAVGGSNAFVPVTDSSGNFTLTKNVTVDTNTFFVDSANDRVGIGELVPTFKLDINGTSGIRVTGPSMYGLMLKSTDATSDFMGIRWRDNANANLWSMGNDFNGTGTQDFWLFDNVNGETVLLANQTATSFLSFGTTNGGLEYDNVTQQMRLFTNGTNKVFVNGTGNVGIGDADPANFKLEVAGHVGPGTDDTHDLGSNTFRWRDLYLGPATLHIGTAIGDEGALTYDTATNALAIDSTGAVAINGGAGSTGCSIDVSGNFSCSGTVAGGGGAGAFVNGGNSFAAAAILGTNDANSLSFETNNVTYLTIASGGGFTLPVDTDWTLTGGVNGLSFDGTTFSVDAANNRVGIGTASPSSSLHVIGPSPADTLGEVRIESDGASTNNAGLTITANNANQNALVQVRSVTSGSGRPAISLTDTGVGGSSISLERTTSKIFTNGTRNDLLIFNQTDGRDVLFGTTNTTLSEKMRITSSGNVLVGIAAKPSGFTNKTIAIGSSGSDYPIIEAQQTSPTGSTGILNIDGYSGTIRVAEIFFANDGATDSGYQAFYTRAAGGSLTEKMRLTSTGNVGIGTASPNEQFEITGNFRLPASTATTGIIKSGANRFIHNFGSTTNFFAGVNAGNLTLTGTDNVGIGSAALSSLTNAQGSVALGSGALDAVTSGNGNVGIGTSALGAIVTGTQNTAVGHVALADSTDSNNTAVGWASQRFFNGGIANASLGTESMFGVGGQSTGDLNTALGYRAGFGLTAGSANVLAGYQAGDTLTTGDYNVLIGYNSDVTTSGLTNAIAIGKNASVGASNSLVLGGTGADAVNVGIGDTTPLALLTVGSGDKFMVNADGDVTSTFTQLDGTDLANGAGSNATTLILDDTTGFNAGNYVFVNATYAKIVTVDSGTQLTISPALTWADNAPVDEYHVPEIGATNLASTLSNRYGRGYFIDGIVTGNGTTYITDNKIESTGTFKINAVSNQPVTFGTGAVTIPGSLSVTSSGTSSFNGPLQLDNAADPDPTGVNGLMYYNTTNNKFRCYQNGAWTDCVTAAGGMSIGGTVTSATAGSLLFANAGPVLAQDNANLFWDDTNNRLGVGTAAPGDRLDVNGGSIFRGNIIQTSDSPVLFGSQPTTANDVGRQMFMDTGSAISSSHRLTMGMQTAGGQISNAFTTGTVIWSGTQNASSTAYDLYLGAHQHDGSTGADPTKMMTFKASNFRVGVHTASPASTFDVSGNMSLGTYAGVNAAPSNGFIVSGNVGIGTNNPLHKLHVVGQGVRVEVGGGDSPRYSLNKSDAGSDQKKWQNYATATGLNFSALNDAESAENFWMQVARGTGTAITNVSFPNGNVGIGMTSPVTRLDLAGNLRTTGKANGLITGSINPTASTAVVGVGTLFTTELVVGDQIGVNGELRTVTVITDNTNLTVDTAFTDTANDTTIDVQYAMAVFRDNGGATKMAMSVTGAVGIGTAAPAAGSLTIGDTNRFIIFTASGTAQTAGDIAINGGDLTTSATTFNLVNSTATTVNFAGAATTLHLGPTGAGAASINLGGGSADTGCTVANASGNLTCTGNITGAAAGTIGYWTRTGTTLNPATAGDNIATGGTGAITSSGLLTASNGLTMSAGALNLTAGAVNLTGTSGSIALTGFGTTSITSTTATGNIFSFASNSLSLGTLHNISSTSSVLSGGVLLSVNKSSSTGSTAFSGAIQAINYTQTFDGGVGLNSTGKVFQATRNISLNNSGQTHTISGALASFSDTSTPLAGTLTSTADVVQISQNYLENTGAALNVTTATTFAGLAMRVNDDGTFTDSTPFAIDNAGNVGIGTTSPGWKLNVTDSESTTTSATKRAALITLTDTGATASGTDFPTGLTVSTSKSNNAGATARITGGDFSATNASQTSGTSFTYGVSGSASGADTNYSIYGLTSTSVGAAYGAYVTADGSSTGDHFGIRADGKGAGTNLYGGYFLAQGTGTTSYGGFFNANSSVGTNYGIHVNASGSSTNYAGVFTGGNVGIGTTTPNEQLEITGNLRLPATTATTGIIKSGTNRFIHSFGTDNFFAGVTAGNLTMTGSSNVGVGLLALSGVTSGINNTALGRDALRASTSGNYQTAVGSQALENSDAGNGNTAVGFNALFTVTTNSFNSALGSEALYLATGSGNTAMGHQAGNTITTGTDNTFIGLSADAGSAALTNATAIGANALVTTSNSLVLGSGVNVGIGTTGPTAKLHIEGSSPEVLLNGTTSNMIRWGTAGVAAPTITTARSVGTKLVLWPNFNSGVTSDYAIGVSSGALWFSTDGDSFNVGHQFYAGATLNSQMNFTGEFGTRTLGGSTSNSLCYNTTTISGLNTLSTCTSSIRYKEDVKSLIVDADKVLALRGVDFKWKDRDERSVGFIAEEVAQLIPEIITYKDGLIDGVEYKLLAPYMIEILRQHHSDIAKLPKLDEIGDLKLAGSVRSQASGFAEMMPSKDMLEEGELVVIDIATGGVRRAVGEKGDSLLAGVVSMKAGFTAGKTEDGSFPIALSGSANVRVVGPIEIGDPIALSLTPGVGVKAEEASYIVGTSLQKREGAGPGVITIWVRPGWYNGTEVAVANTDASDTDINSPIKDIVDFKNQALISIGSMEGVGSLWSIDAEGKIKAKELIVEKVQAKEVVVEQTGDTQAAGEGVVPLGSSTVTIDNALVKYNSRIFVTFYGNTEGGWWISHREDGKFIISLGAAAPTDLPFEYLIVGVVDSRPPAAPLSAPPPEAPPEEAPEPEISPEPAPEPEPEQPTE